MAQNWFKWNGLDCRAMGIILTDPVPLVRPEERVEHIQIPGRSGDLTELEGDAGEAVFNSYIQTVSLIVRGGHRIHEIYNWLRGSGYVTFSGDPDKKQAARVVGAVTLTKHSRNLDMWVGECQFYCQPMKQKLEEPVINITTAGTAVINGGDFISKPLYRLTAEGGTATIHVNGNSELPEPTADKNRIIIRELTAGSKYLVDVETMEVLTDDRSTLITNIAGAFPVLGRGSNFVGGYGWTAIDLLKRERFL